MVAASGAVRPCPGPKGSYKAWDIGIVCGAEHGFPACSSLSQHLSPNTPENLLKTVEGGGGDPLEPIVEF